MTIDKEKLKALAKAANAVTTDVNITMAVGSAPEEVKAVQDYLQHAMPKTILSLLAEIERLELIGRISCNFDGYKAVLAERDQLKAENEVLRKDAERYRFVRNPIGTSSPLAIWNEGKMPLFSGMADAVVDEYMAKELTNKGHGHVFPRHDGVKAKCGGPGLCAECAADQQAKEASHD